MSTTVEELLGIKSAPEEPSPVCAVCGLNAENSTKTFELSEIWAHDLCPWCWGDWETAVGERQEQEPRLDGAATWQAFTDGWVSEQKKRLEAA